MSPSIRALDPLAVPRRRPGTRVRKYRGRLFVANAVDAFELNDVAEFIFRQANGARTLEEIAANVATHFDASTLSAMDSTIEVIVELDAHSVLSIDG